MTRPPPTLPPRPTRAELLALVESDDPEVVRSVARQLASWITELKEVGLPVDTDERCPDCKGTMVDGRCPVCGAFVQAAKAAPLDLRLLAKLASGDGGLRTGALKRAGFLTWEVTPAGLEALKLSEG